MTFLDAPLVDLSAKASLRIKKRYSTSQVKKLAQLAFGKDFAIRKSQEVYLPVYSLAVQNPDGSIRTTYWNALNGRAVHFRPS